MIGLLCHELGFQWIQQLPASFTEEEISAGTVHCDTVALLWWEQFDAN